MKIVALLPAKNEAWIISTYLSSLENIADEIIALDDGSTDGTFETLTVHPKVTVYKASEVLAKESRPNMSARRSLLLSKAREAGATHHIWLDADEAIPPSKAAEFKNCLEKMEPGEKLSMPWITLWKDSDSMRIDSEWDGLRKDFAFCDNGSSIFSDQELSESRTPDMHPSSEATDAGKTRLIPCDIPVLHFQFVFWRRTQFKQAWYRCHELLQGKRSARRINATYSITSMSARTSIVTVPAEWIEGVILPDSVRLNATFEPSSSPHYISIIKWFAEYRIEYFEGLDIWDIPELRDAFIKKLKRAPRPEKFPSFLISLNRLRHALMQAARSGLRMCLFWKN